MIEVNLTAQQAGRLAEELDKALLDYKRLAGALLFEINPAYAEMSERRIRGDAGMFASIDREAAE
jgi:hypothetical protein